MLLELFLFEPAADFFLVRCLRGLGDHHDVGPDRTGKNARGIHDARQDQARQNRAGRDDNSNLSHIFSNDR
jgi:hypothetical protein